MPKITDPIKIGTLEVKNRVVAAPTVVAYADENGFVTKRLLDIYEARAKGGAGIITVEASWFRQDGRMFNRMLCVGEDKYLSGLSELADTIHLCGAKASLQLMHGGRQVITQVSGMQPIAPSEKNPFMGNVPKVMTTKECEELADDFARAALRVKMAGFDAVMFHGTHGFVIQQFMSPYTNDRKDKYGDRLLWVTELIKKTKALCGQDFPVIMRISGDEFIGEQGMTLKMVIEEIVPALEKAGADCIDVSAAVFESLQWALQPMYFPRGVILYLAEGIKKATRLPVVGVGRINDPLFARRAIEDEKCDMVALCRALLADPEFPKKMFSGRDKEVRKCIACNGCMMNTLAGGVVRCAVNPSMGREKESILTPAMRKKKVMVVGGGVGGMEAARICAQRGHEVALYEKQSTLGGLVNLASATPRLYTRELANIVEWLSYQLEKLKVDVRLGEEATLKSIEEFKPDALFIATGSKPLMPAIEGIDKPHVHSLDEYLTGKVQLGSKVAIIGAGHGAEAAVSIARAKKEVTLISEGPPETIGQAPYIDPFRLPSLMQYLQEEKVNILTEARVEKITDKGLIIRHKDGKREEIEADTVLIALGREPVRVLAKALPPGKVEEVYEIGDCARPSTILNAIHTADLFAREI